MSTRKISLRPLNYETDTRLVLVWGGDRFHRWQWNRGVSYREGSIENFPSQLPILSWHIFLIKFSIPFYRIYNFDFVLYRVLIILSFTINRKSLYVIYQSSKSKLCVIKINTIIFLLKEYYLKRVKTTDR